MAFHTDAHAGGSHPAGEHWFFGTGRYGMRDRACCPVPVGCFGSKTASRQRPSR
ncbi:MAG TPA: hypothetical protein VKP65_06020 [Rhodothermales bacterium]|nr:hypothetical protein [Rhodothermales bacterium]